MTRSNSTVNIQILEEASDWFVEFSEGTVDAGGRAQFDSWLRRSPEHVQAYLKVTALWEGARHLVKSRTLGSDELIARVLQEGNVLPMRGMQPAEPLSHRGMTDSIGLTPTAEVINADGIRTRRHFLEKRLLIAACVLLTLVGVGLRVLSQRYVYTTDIGEQRSIRLDDGSVVDLNSRSRIRVQYTEHQRSVELQEGQALFHVAKNPSRPFVVHTDSTNVRAVGTEFDVYKRRSGTTVTVLEGRVAVVAHPLNGGAENTPEGASGRASSDPTISEAGTAEINAGPTRNSAIKRIEDPARPPRHGNSESSQQRGGKSLPRGSEERNGTGAIFLSAGEQLTISRASADAAPHPADTAGATAWIRHKIVFQHTDLSEVVEEFNRYNSRLLVITDESLRSIKITGVFSSTDPDSLIRFLRQLSDVDVRETTTEIQIFRK
jgi:transmembrane sensor